MQFDVGREIGRAWWLIQRLRGRGKGRGGLLSYVRAYLHTYVHTLHTRAGVEACQASGGLGVVFG